MRIISRLEFYNKHHGPDGRFGSSGLASSAGIGRLLKGSMEPDSGFTLSVGGSSPTSGYVVAQSGTSGFLHSSKVLTPSGNVRAAAVEEFRAWMVKNATAIREGGHVGGWHDPATNDITFDVVRVLPASVGRAAAMKAGADANQIAIFSLHEGVVIETGGAGDARP